jgi:excinuclease UvrABC nuclease subunit
MPLNWTQYQSYTQLNLLFVSDKPGLYAINDGNKIIYIGKADDSLKKRLTDHLDFKNEKNTKLIDCLKTSKCFFCYTELSQKKDRDEWEKYLITTNIPCCNIQNNPLVGSK